MTNTEDTEHLASEHPHPQPARLTFTAERLGHETVVSMTQAGQASRPLPLHLAVRCHSPTGFDWGYAGSAPAQLALALCIEVVGRARAERAYQAVKDRLVAPRLEDAWMLSGTTVLAVVEAAEQAARASGGEA